MNLAIFLPNWVGDVVMATPAIRALRRLATGRVIGVMRPYVAGVVEGSPWFDDLLFTHPGRWSQSVVPTAWKLRREKIDLAVLFPNSFRTGLIAWLGGCKRRIGFARYGRSWLLTDALAPERTPEGRLSVSPVIDAYNRLAEQAGCGSTGHEMELFTTQGDEASADRVWEQAKLETLAEVVCLNPGAAFGAAKHWPASHFATLAADLVKRRGCGVLVLCGPAERELAGQIAAMSGFREVVSLGELAPQLSLGLTKACIRRADLLITTDSGPRHFAAAFDRPVVTLFGPTHIAWTETYHPRAVHLQKPVDCGPCQKRVCPLGHHRCMKELTPAEVLGAAEGLLH